MPDLARRNSDAEKAAAVIRDAGGEVVGKTRLQKLAYLLEATGLGSGFEFQYRHYGPYSEELADGLASAYYSNLITEEERTANWGGTYSIFRVKPSRGRNMNSARNEILQIGVNANPISLELVATAVFLANENCPDPWAETARRKPEKAENHLQSAKSLFSRFQSVNTPKRLPTF